MRGRNIEHRMLRIVAIFALNVHKILNGIFMGKR